MGKIGLQLWVHETWSLLLYHYSLRIVYFPYKQLETYLAHSAYVISKFLSSGIWAEFVWILCAIVSPKAVINVYPGSEVSDEVSAAEAWTSKHTQGTGLSSQGLSEGCILESTLSFLPSGSLLMAACCIKVNEWNWQWRSAIKKEVMFGDLIMKVASHHLYGILLVRNKLLLHPSLRWKEYISMLTLQGGCLWRLS